MTKTRKSEEESAVGLEGDMRSVTNTAEQSKRDLLMQGWVMGGNPNAILAQEAEGQAEVAEADVLPKEMSDNDIAALEAEGFEFLGPVSGDDLFRYVKFPKGWTKQPTDHSMYTDLLDQHGRVRGSIGYKAAFYDRWANISVYSRFIISGRDSSFAVCDRGTPVDGERDGKVLFESEYVCSALHVVKDYEEYDAARQVCADWLAKHYPERRDSAAYWNDDCMT